MATAVATRPLFSGGIMVGQDTATFFYPIFTALGDRLRSGDIPGWNPHQFAGVPFAADPESGWMYLPAMLLFSLLPISAAATVWLLSHLLLAGFATFALGRVLGLGAPGALTAAFAVEFSGLLFARTVCCPAYGQVAAWMPLVFLTAELAVRTRGWPARLVCWGMAGFALGQIFVAWLGQGSYYALLAFGFYVVARTTVLPPDHASPIWPRLRALPLHLTVPILVGMALSAAAILPRLAYLDRTNLADGYTGDLAWAAVLGGWDAEATVGQLLRPTFYYLGGAVLVLALLALPLSRARHAAPIFAAMAIGAVVLAQREATWLHRPLYLLLPRFEELHRHWPERDMVVFAVGPAILAGVATHALGRWTGHRWQLLSCAFGPLLLLLFLDDQLGSIDRVPIRAAFAIAGTLLLLGHRAAWMRRFAPPVLAFIVLIDLLAVGRFNLDHGYYGGFHPFNLGAYATPSGAAAFLRDRSATDPSPARYFGYDPGLHRPNEAPPLYRYAFADPRAQALLVNNRATLLGLEDIQGYNPIQPERYGRFMKQLNGFAQEYHEVNIYPAGLESPLLDLLNARYIVVPATAPPDRVDLQRLSGRFLTVYQDDAVRVLTNPNALPRAWIVHQARQTSTQDALAALAAGQVDPLQEALLEQSPPNLSVSESPSFDLVETLLREPDRLRFRVRTDAAGLLVLSETADPDWRAEIDGSEAPILIANGLLRALPIQAGTYIVELRYESVSLQRGTAISVVAYMLLIGTWSVAARTMVRSRRVGTRTPLALERR